MNVLNQYHLLGSGKGLANFSRSYLSWRLLWIHVSWSVIYFCRQGFLTKGWMPCFIHTNLNLCFSTYFLSLNFNFKYIFGKPILIGNRLNKFRQKNHRILLYHLVFLNTHFGCLVNMNNLSYFEKFLFLHMFCLRTGFH